MRITDAEVVPVVVPARPGSVDSEEWGAQNWPFVPKQIILLHTDEGVTGIGETQREQPTDEIVKAATLLEGRDVLRSNLQNVFREKPLSLPSRTSDEWDMDLGPYPRGYEGFEMAVFDLIGKKLGVPVHMLLGGAVRDSIRVHYWIGQQTPEDSATAVRTAIGRGFKGIKIKCKLEEPNVERLRAMLDAGGPDFKVTVDPNERFHTVEQTLALAAELKPLNNVEMFEDPIPRNEFDDEDLARYREMRGKLPFPLAITPKDLAGTVKAVKAEAADFMNTPGSSMITFVKSSAVAEGAGIPVWHGAGVDLGIMETSYLHASSVVSNCVLANDVVGSWVREDDLIVDGLRFEDGETAVPQKPGLGCELDLDALEKYRTDR